MDHSYNLRPTHTSWSDTQLEEIEYIVAKDCQRLGAAPQVGEDGGHVAVLAGGRGRIADARGGGNG